MTPTAPEVKNIREILRLQRETESHASLLDRVAEWVSGVAGGPAFIVGHMVWVAVWIALNATGTASFDPFPFNLLMFAVSVEAILLTGFVLRAQRRMRKQADKWAQLELQINLLAEQELTAILRVLCEMAEHVGIDVARCDPAVEQFRSRTDVRTLAATLDAEREAAEASESPAAGPPGLPGAVNE
jgi:uncharacterized membrane protein